MKILLTIPALLLLIGCSSPGGAGGPGTPGNANKPIGENCEINVPGNATNLEVATAFNQWRDKCAPDETMLTQALKSLE